MPEAIHRVPIRNSSQGNSVFLREQDNTRKIKISELEDLQKLAASANGDPDK